jgi:hypothetical protein
MLNRGHRAAFEEDAPPSRRHLQAKGRRMAAIVRWIEARTRHLVVAILVLVLVTIFTFDIFIANWDPPFWFMAFMGGGPIEYLQWLCLGAAALTAVWVSSLQAQQNEHEASMFWRLFAVGTMLMLIEDAGNTSKLIMAVLQRYLDLPYGLARLPVFLLIGGVMLYALLRYWNVVLASKGVRGYLFSGYAAYGITQFLSVPFSLIGDQTPAGERLLSLPLLNRLPRLSEPIWGATEDNTGTVFMDFVVEESIELLGAGLLLTAATRARLRYRARSKQGRPPAAGHVADGAMQHDVTR